MLPSVSGALSLSVMEMGSMCMRVCVCVCVFVFLWVGGSVVRWREGVGVEMG